MISQKRKNQKKKPLPLILENVLAVGFASPLVPTSLSWVMMVSLMSKMLPLVPIVIVNRRLMIVRPKPLAGMSNDSVIWRVLCTTV